MSDGRAGPVSRRAFVRLPKISEVLL